MKKKSGLNNLKQLVYVLAIISTIVYIVYRIGFTLPVDLGILENDSRVDYPVDEIPNLPIYDIGIKTIELYKEKISTAKTLFANGPAGVFELEEFNKGTEELLEAMAESEGFSIIGGGHLAAAASSMTSGDGITHISSGGGASINLISGKELPAVKALIDSAKKN